MICLFAGTIMAFPDNLKVKQLKLVKFTRKGLYCIPGKFYIDPWRPVEMAVISHGHSDHAKWGMKKYLCHHLTKPILKIRLGADIEVHSIGYEEQISINGVKLSFHPAGHILGSAQVRLEYKGFVTVYSGDYKLQDDGLSTPFQLVKCNEFITESTFALPIYRWLTAQEYCNQMRAWVAENQSMGKTSVFVGYSLGKAQRIMKSLDGMGKIFVHQSVAQLNTAFELAGIKLPDYETLNATDDVKKMDKEIIIVPSAVLDSKLISKIPNRATAICSGWMQVRGSRRWRSTDAGFAVSDHADWNGLLETVKGTEAEKIYVNHGQTAVFSKYLNEIGIEAKEAPSHFENYN